MQPSRESNVATRCGGPRIHFRQLSLFLGGSPVLEGVEFEVHPGTIHCIIGPNGGGKTSLLRCLLGQMPYRGRIDLDWGRNRVAGYVPQSLHFDPTLPITVGDFMNMISSDRPAFLGAVASRTPHIDAALEKVGMLGKKRSCFGTLSGGERQRILVAQALIPMPALLVLDEPMTGLDRAGSATLEGLVSGLRADGLTIVWVHHDLQHVQRIADTVTCINRHVMFSGPPAGVLTPDRILTLFSPEPEQSRAAVAAP